MLTPREIIDFRVNDWISAQDSGSFLESQRRDNQPIQESDSEDPFCCRCEYHLIPKCIGDPLWDIAMSSAVRGFLKRDHIRLQPLQFLNGHFEPFFEMGTVLDESRPWSIVQQVKGQDTKLGRLA